MLPLPAPLLQPMWLIAAETHRMVHRGKAKAKRGACAEEEDGVGAIAEGTARHGDRLTEHWGGCCSLLRGMKQASTSLVWDGVRT